MVQLKGCLVAASVSAILLCGRASAQAVWTGGGDSNNWSDSDNWSPDPSFAGNEEVPAGSDALTFNLSGGGSLNSTVDNSYSITSLSFISSGAEGIMVDNAEGSLCISGTVSDQTSNQVALNVNIGGAANVTSSGGGTLILTGDNTYQGGTSITKDGTLVVGSNSALGTGTLMLSAGTNFTTVDSSCYTISNDITLCGSGTVQLLGGSMGTMLTLSGMISSSSCTSLEIVAPGCGGTDTITFTSGCSSFSGGVSVDSGNINLVVGASSSGGPGDLSSGPLGTGTLMLSSGNNLTTTNGDSFEIDNAMTLCGGGMVTIFNSLSDSGGGHGLTLGGMITGSSELSVVASFNDCANMLTLTSGCSTFSGGVSVQGGNVNLVVGASSTGCEGNVTQGPLGTGPLMLSSGNNFTTAGGDGSVTINNDINLCGGGTVTLLGGSMGTTLTLGGNISGSNELEVVAPGCGGANYLTFTYAGSTFCGGLKVDEGQTSIAVGASSTGPAGAPTAGPLGTGTVMLSANNDFTTTGGTCFTIANNITLCGGDQVYVLAVGCNNMLTLTGMITGSSSLDVGSPDMTNSLTLTSGCSTFCGGVSVEQDTTLVVGASGVGSVGDITSSPIGTGTLSLGNASALVTPSGTCITILNPITLGTESSEGCVFAYIGGISSTLTLLGNITDNDAPGSLVIQGNTDLEGCNSYSGGTRLDSNVTLTVGSNNGLGTGSFTADSGSTTTFSSSAPNIYGMSLNAATVNFTSAGGNPLLSGLTMMCGSVINFAANSTPTVENMSSDTSSSDQINLGTGATLTFDVGVDPTFNGTINSVGSGGSVVINGMGGGAEFDLENANTYAGGTTVSGNAFLVADHNGALGTGSLTLNSGAAFGVNTGVILTNQIVNNGGTIVGYGSLAPASAETLNFGSGAVIAGGGGLLANSAPVIGTLTVGSNASVVFAGGSSMQFSMQNDTLAAGTGYSAINFGGTVTFDGTVSPSTQFTIQIIGIDGSGLNTGTAATFTTPSSYTWTLMSASSITFTSGFNASDFNIDTSNFSNANSGNFYVTDTGTSLVLNFTPVPEPSTWALMIGGMCMLVGAAVRRRRRA